MLILALYVDDILIILLTGNDPEKYKRQRYTMQSTIQTIQRSCWKLTIFSELPAAEKLLDYRKQSERDWKDLKRIFCYMRASTEI